MSDREAHSGSRLRELAAEEIRVALARKRMSATELARRTGMKQPYISRRMTGEIAFDLDDLEVIARELGVTVVDLLKGSGGQTTAAKLRLTERPIPHPVDPRQPNGRPRRDKPAEPQPNGPPASHPVNPASRRPVRVPRAPVMASAV